METEERAKLMGWVPKEKFRGDPEKWIEAEVFVERADNVMPIMKENLNRMEQKFDDYTKSSKTEIGKLTEQLQRMAELSQTAADRAYKRAVNDLKHQQKDAIREGDVERFDAIEKQIDNLQDGFPENKPSTKTTNDEEHPDFAPWKKTNFWYGQDKELSAFANGIAQVIINEMPTIDGKEFYDEITKRVKDSFPHKFSNRNREKSDAVEGGGDGERTSGKKGKSYNDLPPEAKIACDNFVKDGLFKDRQEYVKDYFVEA